MSNPVTINKEDLKEFEAFKIVQKAKNEEKEAQEELVKKMEEFHKKRQELEKEFGVQLSVDASQVNEALKVANQAIGKAFELLNQIQIGWIPKQ